MNLFTEENQTGLVGVSHCGWSETNLDKVSGIPKAVHDILYQAISFIWFQDIPPEQSWLAEIVLIC
jgi:hypothetical protein